MRQNFTYLAQSYLSISLTSTTGDYLKFPKHTILLLHHSLLLLFSLTAVSFSTRSHDILLRMKSYSHPQRSKLKIPSAKSSSIALDQELTIFFVFVKGQIVNSFSFVEGIRSLTKLLILPRQHKSSVEDEVVWKQQPNLAPGL